MSSNAHLAAGRAAGTVSQLADFGRRRPATVLWLLLYTAVAVLAPSPGSLLVTAALVAVLAVRLRLAGRSVPVAGRRLP